MWSDMPVLIADLQRYVGVEVPTAIAHKVLAHAMTELPQGAGSAWLIKRAARIYREYDGPPRPS